MQSENSKNTLCPTCGTTAINDKIHEICLLAKNGELFKHCQDKLGTEDDPCFSCKHNKVIEIPGSFLFMDTVTHADGSMQFKETHRCQKCHTVYSFLNSNESFMPNSNHPSSEGEI